MFSGFSRESDYPRYRFSPKGGPYCQVRITCGICLAWSTPTPFNVLFRQHAAVPLLRPRVTPYGSHGILTVSAIALAVRLRLRTRLTPGRLTLPGKPWSCGGGESHPPYRYLYLHLLFHALQRGSSPAFDAHGMLPYRYFYHLLSRAFGICLIPDYYPCPDPRLVSCYALFE